MVDGERKRADKSGEIPLPSEMPADKERLEGDVDENRHFTVRRDCDKRVVRHDKRDWMCPEFSSM